MELIDDNLVYIKTDFLLLKGRTFQGNVLMRKENSIIFISVFKSNWQQENC